MNNIKIAFFDIDGTLIAMDRDTMSEQMEDTLLQLQKTELSSVLRPDDRLAACRSFQE